eukprot:sb/3468495/
MFTCVARCLDDWTYTYRSIRSDEVTTYFADVAGIDNPYQYNVDRLQLTFSSLHIKPNSVSWMVDGNNMTATEEQSYNSSSWIYYVDSDGLPDKTYTAQATIMFDQVNGSTSDLEDAIVSREMTVFKRVICEFNSHSSSLTFDPFSEVSVTPDSATLTKTDDVATFTCNVEQDPSLDTANRTFVRSWWIGDRKIDGKTAEEITVSNGPSYVGNLSCNVVWESPELWNTTSTATVNASGIEMEGEYPSQNIIRVYFDNTY